MECNGKVRKLRGKKVSSTVRLTQHLRVLINKTNPPPKKSVYCEIFSCTFKYQELPLRTLSYSWIYKKLVALSVCNKTGELFYLKPFYEIAYIFKAVSFV